MLNHLIKTAIVAATLLSAIPANAWEKEDRQKYRRFYQNVTMMDLPKLIGNKVWVRYAEDTDQIGAIVHMMDGREVFCGTFDGLTMVFGWDSVVYENRALRERYPLWQEALADGRVGYGAFKYVPETGGLYLYLRQGSYWWETGIGHLQTDIPAAIYTACPEFPSAKSLGLKVNTKQTSVKYHEMIKQDAGNRVKRPDLVTEVTVEKY